MVTILLSKSIKQFHKTLINNQLKNDLPYFRMKSLALPNLQSTLIKQYYTVFDSSNDTIIHYKSIYSYLK